jgi:hypothetical protein
VAGAMVSGWLRESGAGAVVGNWKVTVCVAVSTAVTWTLFTMCTWFLL